MSKKAKETTKQNQTQTTKIDPMVMGMATSNYDKANAVANSLSGYTGERVAGFNDDQMAGQDALRGIGQGTSAGLGAAEDTARASTQFAPGSVSGKGYDAALANASTIRRGDVRDVKAGLLKDADLSAYLNPYTDEVVDKSLADLERQRRIALMDNRNRAQAASAFGGDRHAVLESLTNDASLRNSGSLAAQLRMAGYDRAVDGASGDINRTFAADQGNQGYDFNVANANAGYQTQAALANAAARNQSLQFGAGQDLAAQMANQDGEIAAAGLRQSGAGLLANVGGQQLQDALTRAGALQTVGDAQQANVQAGLDAAYADFLRTQEMALAGQGLRTAALGGVPVPTTTSGSSTSVTQTKDTGKSISDAIKLAAMFAPSDERLKEDVVTAGYDGKGRRWVDFRYLWDEADTVRRGVIAQEILKTDPEAVAMHPEGFLMVDYSMLED